MEDELPLWDLRDQRILDALDLRARLVPRMGRIQSLYHDDGVEIEEVLQRCTPCWREPGPPTPRSLEDDAVFGTWVSILVSEACRLADSAPTMAAELELNLYLARSGAPSKLLEHGGRRRAHSADSILPVLQAQPWWPSGRTSLRVPAEVAKMAYRHGISVADRWLHDLEPDGPGHVELGEQQRAVWLGELADEAIACREVYTGGQIEPFVILSALHGEYWLRADEERTFLTDGARALLRAAQELVRTAEDVARISALWE